MSASKNLGKVFMTPKGIWDKTLNYTKLDIVTNKVGKISCGYIATTDIEKNVEITDNRWLKLFELLDGDLTEEYKAVQTDVINKATDVDTNKKAVELIYSQMQKLYDVEISTTTPTNERTGLWINPDDISGVISIPEIKDDEVSDVDTWSSKKIDNVTGSLKEDLKNYAKSDFRYVPTTENNKFCRWDTGIIQPLDGKSVSSRIPVEEFENVKIYSNNDIFDICFFNGETFISGSNALPKSFSIPANCNNVIISFNGLDTNIALVYTSKIDDYIVNTQVLPAYEFNVETTKYFMRWDNGKIYPSNDYMMTKPFIVEPNREYYVTGAVTIAACFLNGSTFVSGTALNGVDHFTIPEGCNRCVVDFNIITDLPTIMVRDPLLRNTSLCYGKVLGCLGDSITQGVGNNNHSWVDKMQIMCGFKSVYNYGVSGDTIEKMHDRIDAMESTLDYITLFGGTNNALWSNSQSISDFKSAFDSLVSSIIEKYPTSKVLGIIPPKYNYSSGDVTRNWNVPTSPNNLKLIDFVNAEIEIYSKYSVPIVNLFSCCNIQPDINAQKIGLMPDGVHPSQKGYFDFIAPKIAEALKSI